MLLFDVADQIAKNNYDTTMYGAKFFNFYATGDDMPGFTSADTGSHLYVDDPFRTRGRRSSWWRRGRCRCARCAGVTTGRPS